MKTIFLAILACFLSVQISQAQWQPDVRLTNNNSSSQTSLSNAWSIASSGNSLHVVWEDNRDVNSEIYYKRSTDGGLNWGADTRLTNNTSVSNQPSIAVSGSVVHVVWSDSRDGQYEIYYKRSTDAGVTWGADTRLSALDFFYSAIPSLAVSDSDVHVVWEDRRFGYGIFYKGSSDGGVSWGADKRLSDSAAYATVRGDVSVAVSGLLVNAIWTDYRTDTNGEIFYKRSTDGGITWGSDLRLTNNPSLSYSPSISISGLVVHVVWNDKRDGFTQIFYNHSTDGGISWGTDTRLTSNIITLYHSNISTSGSNVHVVWRDVTTGNTSVFYKRSTDGGTSWGNDLQLINNPSHAVSASISASGSAVHVVWSDDRDGNYEIYYKRDPTGSPTGIENIGSELPREFNLEQNYPNPFNPSSTIKFQIPNSGYVTLVVYDVLGKEVSTLISEQMEAGTYIKQFDAKNLTSGVYFYQLKVGNPSSGSGQSFTETKKFILMK